MFPKIEEPLDARRLLQSDDVIDARLTVRNIVIAGRRTSVRLEADMWQALCEIARRHEASVNQICTLVGKRRSGSSLTAALRVFALRYFRSAAADDAERSERLASPASRGVGVVQLERGPV